MRKMRKTLPFILAALILCTVAGMAFQVYAKEDSNRIAEGVYIGSVYVGGMTEEEAEAAIDEYINKIKKTVFTLEAGENSIELTAEQMGLLAENRNVIQEALDICRSGNLIKRYKDKKDLEQGGKILELDLSINKNAIVALLNDNESSLNVEAVNNGLVRENGTFRVIEGNTGVKVNVEESAEVIAEFFKSGWNGEDAVITLAAEVVEPQGTKEELAKVKDILGSFSTNYSTSASGRCTNIAVATSKIDGTLLYPGEEFSVGKAINPMDKANGYELAGSYENGQTVQTYGGGVCQVSTTLYNAVILAELEITQRSNHSMIVSYVKPSMDAAIAGDYKDLKFKNNTDAPIYIEGYTKGKDVYFNIYGEETRPSNRVVSYVSEVISQNDPATQFVASGDPVGTIRTTQSKHTGYVAQLWKVITIDGVETSREQFNKSTYNASPKIVSVGIASADPAATEAVSAALATQNEAAIYAAVGMYTAPAATEPPAEEPVISQEEQAITGTVDESEITGGGDGQ